MFSWWFNIPTAVSEKFQPKITQCISVNRPVLTISPFCSSLIDYDCAIQMNQYISPMPFACESHPGINKSICRVYLLSSPLHPSGLSLLPRSSSNMRSLMAWPPSLTPMSTLNYPMLCPSRCNFYERVGIIPKDLTKDLTTAVVT